MFAIFASADGSAYMRDEMFRQNGGNYGDSWLPLIVVVAIVAGFAWCHFAAEEKRRQQYLLNMEAERLRRAERKQAKDEQAEFSDEPEVKPRRKKKEQPAVTPVAPAIAPAAKVIVDIPPLTESELAARTADELFALAMEPSTGAEEIPPLPVPMPPAIPCVEVEPGLDYDKWVAMLEDHRSKGINTDFLEDFVDKHPRNPKNQPR